MKSHIAALLFILLTSLAHAADDYSAKVVGISDGDTITVLTAEKKQVKIRLHGIDEPETGQDFGSKAKQAASELAFGKQVTIKVKDTDRYGRTVAEVILPDGKSLNREMVGKGFAWWYRQYSPKDRELERIESEAKSEKRGLWTQDDPTPPWDWRHGKGVAATEELVGNRNSHVFHTPKLLERRTNEGRESGQVQDGGGSQGGGVSESGGLQVSRLYQQECLPAVFLYPTDGSRPGIVVTNGKTTARLSSRRSCR